MATLLLRPVHLLVLLHGLSLAFATGTTYSCNSQTAQKFHQDCAVAANQLVLSLTGDDGLAHVPNDDISHTYGKCQARVRASGTEKTAQGTSLLLSFAQIGARCQDGTFANSDASIDGGLKGEANWKRGLSRARAAAVAKAPFSLINRFKRDMHDSSPQKQRLAKRGEIMAARKGSNGDMYRLMMVSAHGVPELAATSPKVNSMFFQRSREFMQHHFSTEDNSDLVFGNAYPIANGHVSVITLGVKLRGGQTSWKAFVESQKDNGDTIKALVADGTWMFTMNKYVAAYFEVLNSSGQVVFNFMIYGFDSVSSPLPSK
ncbi:hypothetical protein Dda_1069 [Drechslerella dactyloides]|uniref:Uncharacterized protein n=1 Tax=Drechslerella dactyloides TaxID=74499 RepID=A0AAD6J8I9_DREDA|nr:hypothetical protein Dda_1069 [Drechslerella dactyloides]